MKKLKIKKSIYVKSEGRKKVFAMDEKSGLYFICKDMAAEVVQLLAKKGSRGGLSQAELKGMIFSKPKTKPTRREIDRLDLAVREMKWVGLLVGSRILNSNQRKAMIRSSALSFVSVIWMLGGDHGANNCDPNQPNCQAAPGGGFACKCCDWMNVYDVLKTTCSTQAECLAT